MKDRLARLWIPPPHIGEHGRGFWTRTGRILIEKGILTPGDRESFTALCLAYNRMIEAEIQMQKEGMTVTGSRGDTKKSPCFTIWKVSCDQFNLLAKEFGLTPASRNKIKVEDPPEKDSEKNGFFKLERR
jgi:P27 family predicted phage terminase small subunit